MNKEEALSHAILLASKAHAGQFDKGGKPYILHPLHLMSQLLFDTELATIAVLHDTIEDSSLTIKKLRAIGFSNRVLEALDLLTHKTHQDYLLDYIPAIATNIDAIRVKRKDLEHNSDITRLRSLREKDFARLEKYSRAFHYLTRAKENHAK